MIQFNATFYDKKHQSSFKLISYRRMQYTKETKSFMHVHNFTEIYFITDGEGYFHTQNEKVKIEKGMIVINNPSVPHYETSSTENPLGYALFSVDGISFSSGKNTKLIHIDEDVPKQKLQTFFFDYSAYYNQLYDVLTNVETEASQQKPLWDIAFFAEFNKFMIFLLRDTSLSFAPYSTKDKKGSLGPAYSYIKARYPEDISLDFLANISKLNKYYLSHAFKKKFGLSPIQYLNKLRCEEAKKLLETTDLSIAEIAVQVGYNSISHFSEMYKKIMGEAPIVTRKKFSNQ